MRRCSLRVIKNSRVFRDMVYILYHYVYIAGCFSGTEKHRHCGVLMSGSQNLTTAGNLVTLQFHTDDVDADDENGDKDDTPLIRVQQHPQPASTDRTYKGFWLRFEGELSICCTSVNGSSLFSSYNIQGLIIHEPSEVEAPGRGPR